jgi:hypothetical protein
VDKGRFTISTAGGMQPVWSRDGKELFYIDTDGNIIGVRVGEGPTWSASPALRIPLAANAYFRSSGSTAGRTYDVSLDGKRFLLVKDAGATAKASAAPSIVVVRNWIEELKRLVHP